MKHSYRAHITQTALLTLSLLFAVPAFSQRRFEWRAFYPEGLARQNATKVVMPNYPEDADTTGLSVIVRVKLAIDAEGQVAGIRVRQYTPDVFKRAIADSVSKWQIKFPDGHGEGKYILTRLTFRFFSDEGRGVVELYTPGPGVKTNEPLGYTNTERESREWIDWEEIPIKKVSLP
jgi:hypothetical protein